MCHRKIRIHYLTNRLIYSQRRASLQPQQAAGQLLADLSEFRPETSNYDHCDAFGAARGEQDPAIGLREPQSAQQQCGGADWRCGMR